MFGEPPTSNGRMILVKSLTKRFANREVLRGVSMDVRRGEVAVMIGGSGGGKSTLLRCINGLETFDEGRVEVDDLTLSPGPQCGDGFTMLQKLRCRVGMVFQQFNLFPHLSVLQNVMCGPLYVRKVPHEAAEPRARALLDRVGLSDKVDARPGSLSGGQQQRVAIARTLANEPEVILFDEPTSALDPRMTAEVLSVMADLAAEGQTMVVVSHAMGFVRKSAHRVHVLAGGEIIESGVPEQVFDAPARAETKEFLADTQSR
jgi:ABC-type polar amino acid transport system ATPase subunit